MLYEITDGKKKTWVQEIPMRLLRLSFRKKLRIFFRFLIGLKGYVQVQTSNGPRYFRLVRKRSK